MFQLNIAFTNVSKGLIRKDQIIHIFVNFPLNIYYLIKGIFTLIKNLKINVALFCNKFHFLHSVNSYIITGTDDGGTAPDNMHISSHWYKNPAPTPIRLKPSVC